MSVGGDARGPRRWVGLGFETAGLAGGLLWVAVSVADPKAEVARNRIWTLALLGMSLGVFGLFHRMSASLGRVTRAALLAAAVGLGLMTAASFVEYWVLFGLPHEGAGWGPMARGIAWMTFLIGTLTLVASSIVAGSGMLLVRTKPIALGLLLALLVPVTVALAFVGPGAAALPIAALSSFSFVKGRHAARGRGTEI
jgi:hypothetical protein